MEKIRFKDGTVVEAEKNGSCFITDEKPAFPEDLRDIKVEGETSTLISNGQIVECASIDGRYWFTILEASPEDVKIRALENTISQQNDAIVELSEMMAAMMG